MEPTQIHAGDSAAWSRDVPDRPASAGWGLRYVFSGPDRQVVEALQTTPYQVEVSAETTANWQPGLYRWVALAFRGDQRLTVATGTLDVSANLETAEPTDARTHAQKMLGLIEAALEKRIPKDQQSYEIDGMRLDRIPIERLDTLRTKYQREIQRAKSSRWPCGRHVKFRLR
jgi:hypothetical protein